jgi:hypothetical protein
MGGKIQTEVHSGDYGNILNSAIIQRKKGFSSSRENKFCRVPIVAQEMQYSKLVLSQIT